LAGNRFLQVNLTGSEAKEAFATIDVAEFINRALAAAAGAIGADGGSGHGWWRW
jgi:hypothetical protein